MSERSGENVRLTRKVCKVYLLLQRLHRQAKGALLQAAGVFRTKRVARSVVISSESDKAVVKIRAATTNDAPGIWRLVTESGVLDCNSVYAYGLLCRDFGDTCLVACRIREDGGRQREEILGFVTAYRLPRDPGVLFVWQIGVAATAKKQGLGRRLLEALVERCSASTLEAIEATIAPSNVASRKLFESLARRLQAPLVDCEGFDAALFPEPSHESEPRIRIGPLRSVSVHPPQRRLVGIHVHPQKKVK